MPSNNAHTHRHLHIYTQFQSIVICIKSTLKRRRPPTTEKNSALAKF